jgi:type IV pilus assembly protein PilM
MQKKRTAIGLDIGGQTVKLVRLTQTPRGLRVDEAALFNWPAEPLPEGEEKADRLRDWLHSLKIRGGQATIAISGSFCNVQLTTFPRASEAALHRMVRLEAQRQSGIFEQEVASDFITYAAAANGQTRVLLALCRESTVKSEIKLASDTGLTVDHITLSNLALNNAFCFTPNGSAQGVAVFVDVGRDSTNIAVSQDGTLRFARSFASGGSAFTAAVARAAKLTESGAEQWKQGQGQLPLDRGPLDAGEEALMQAAENWLAEFNDTLTHFFEQSAGEFTAYDRIVLTGGGALLGNFASWVALRTGRPVEIGAPFRVLGKEAAALPAEVKDDPRFAVALGLALQGLRLTPTLNLLPSALKEKREVRRRARELAVYTALATLIFFTLLAAAMNKLAHANARIEAQRRSLVECQQLASRINELRDQRRRTTELLNPILDLANRAQKLLIVWRDVSSQRLGNDWFTLFADADSYYGVTPPAGAALPSPFRGGNTTSPAEKREAAESLSLMILEGYTPNKNFETVDLFAQMLEQDFPEFMKVDTLREDRRVADAKADEWWAKTGHRRFTLELQLNWARVPDQNLPPAVSAAADTPPADNP